MTALYWGLEFTKVLGAYFVLMIVYPSFLCRRFLKGKSLTFRFGFCTTVSVLGINTVVLLLGLIHFLNPWVVRILFYGPLVYFIVKKIMSGKADIPMLLRVLNGTFGIRQFFLKFGKKLQRKCAGILKRGFQRVKGHFAEYGLLFVLLVFGCMYFSYGAFQDYSYGFGDIYPHNQWIYALTQGQIFSDGVYPEGMHCFIYAMHTLFGIRIYSCMLFTQGIHVMVFLLSAYLFLKEIFRFRFTPHFALALFLTLDVVCIDSVFGMSRLQWTIPQEFGMYAMFLCPAFLIRYMNTPKEEIRLPQNKWGKKLQFLKKAYYNENLLVFMLAIAVTLAVHFYPTIMAFFLCVAFVPVLFSRIFKSTRFVSLVGAVLVGVLIAVVPMAGALASGIPFQGSINWAMNVINGVEGAASGYMAPDGETDAAGSADGQGSGGLENGGNGSNAGGNQGGPHRQPLLHLGPEDGQKLLEDLPQTLSKILGILGHELCPGIGHLRSGKLCRHRQHHSQQNQHQRNPSFHAAPTISCIKSIRVRSMGTDRHRIAPLPSSRSTLPRAALPPSVQTEADTSAVRPIPADLRSSSRKSPSRSPSASNSCISSATGSSRRSATPSTMAHTAIETSSARSFSCLHSPVSTTAIRIPAVHFQNASIKTETES